MSVQGSSWQSKAEIQADKNWLSQTCLSVLEIFWYLWYPGDPPRDAESLGRSLYLWGAVYLSKQSGIETFLAIAVRVMGWMKVVQALLLHTKLWLG
jgi:hypothetical protein